MAGYDYDPKCCQCDAPGDIRNDLTGDWTCSDHAPSSTRLAAAAEAAPHVVVELRGGLSLPDSTMQRLRGELADALWATISEAPDPPFTASEVRARRAAEIRALIARHAPEQPDV